MTIRTRSAGTNLNARKTVSVNDVNWSDLIFVMEEKHKSRLFAEFKRAVKHKTIYVLDLPVKYLLFTT